MPKLRRNERRELINHLVGNCSCDSEPLFEEDDKGALEKLELNQLRELAFEDEDDIEEAECEVQNQMPDALREKIDAMKKKKKKGPPVPPGAESASEEEEEDEEMTGNIAFEDLPEEWQEDIKLARNQRQQQKDQLVAKITTNQGSGGFTVDELNEMSNDQLSKIAAYVPSATSGNSKPRVSRATLNSGARRLGGHVPTESQPTTNTTKARKPIPSAIIDWSSTN